MKGAQRQETVQRQGQFLMHQMLQLGKALEMSAPEFDEVVERELEENPALEAVDKAAPDEQEQAYTDDGPEFNETSEDLQRADYASPDDIPFSRRDSRNRDGDERRSEMTAPDEYLSIYDELDNQLAERSLSPEQELIAQHIIGNLDSNGYLRRDLTSLADDMAIDSGFYPTDEQMRQALATVQSLEPAGIGASTLQECLELQLERLPESQTRDDALEIVRDHFEALHMRHSHRIISGMKASEKRVTQALDLITHLNPKPGSLLGSGPGSKAQPIIPDFFIDNRDGRITVTLNNNIPELRIEESFEKAMKRLELPSGRHRVKGSEFVVNRYRDARDFISMLSARQETLFRVMTAIVKLQHDYFLTEDVHSLRPMQIKDVAELTGYDLPTISRATKNKYAATPWGMFPLKFFFVEPRGKEGEEYTVREAMELLQGLIKQEDKKHPLSDERLRELLAAQGFVMSRRTVAKYRDKLDIPSARLRKQM